jgi:PAS domain S-box-containing protein
MGTIENAVSDKLNWGPRIDALDQLLVGVARVSKTGELTYVNQAMSAIAGYDIPSGATLHDLFPNEEDLQNVTTHLAARFTERKRDEYTAFLTRRKDSRRIPVLISAVPETGEDGQVVGSIAFVRSLVTEHAVSLIHRHIETSPDSRTLLKAVAEDISRLVPLDQMMVLLYSSDRLTFRNLFSYAPSGEVYWDVR